MAGIANGVEMGQPRGESSSTSELRPRHAPDGPDADGEGHRASQLCALGLALALAVVSVSAMGWTRATGDAWFRSPSLYESNGDANKYFVDCSPVTGLCPRDGATREPVVPCEPDVGRVAAAMELLGNGTLYALAGSVEPGVSYTDRIRRCVDAMIATNAVVALSAAVSLPLAYRKSSARASTALRLRVVNILVFVLAVVYCVYLGLAVGSLQADVREMGTGIGTFNDLDGDESKETLFDWQPPAYTFACALLTTTCGVGVAFSNMCR